MTQQRRLILGPPGTGKTTRLLSIVEQELDGGVLPEEIAFVSFTTKAANEAADRACARFNMTRKDLPHFRTLHSLAYWRAGLRRDEVFGRQHKAELSRLLGVKFSNMGTATEEGLPTGAERGDRLMFVQQLARVRCVPLAQQWRETPEELSWAELKQFDAAYNGYRRDAGLWDFTDMLEGWGDDRLGRIRVAVVDEAQDLSQLQWRVVEAAFAGVERLYIAGDDEQAIYQWSGADVPHFLHLEAEREILEHSYRLPAEIWEVAQHLSGRIVAKYQKHWQPARQGGLVERHMAPEELRMGEGTWLLLARNNYMLHRLERHARAQGFAYSSRGNATSVRATHRHAIYAWEALRRGREVALAEARGVYGLLRLGSGVTRGHKTLPGADDRQAVGMAQLRAQHGLVAPDAPWYEVLRGIPAGQTEYYRDILANEGSLKKAPRIHVSTIHGVKGGEADHVLLMTDMSPRCHQAYRAEPDAEHRVYYVGATRAKQSLHIVAPQTDMAYGL